MFVVCVRGTHPPRISAAAPVSGTVLEAASVPRLAHVHRRRFLGSIGASDALACGPRNAIVATLPKLDSQRLRAPTTRRKPPPHRLRLYACTRRSVTADPGRLRTRERAVWPAHPQHKNPTRPPPPSTAPCRASRLAPPAGSSLLHEGVNVHDGLALLLRTRRRLFLALLLLQRPAPRLELRLWRRRRCLKHLHVALPPLEHGHRRECPDNGRHEHAAHDCTTAARQRKTLQVDRRGRTGRNARHCMQV